MREVEVIVPLPAEVSDMVQEDCRDCWFARNQLRFALDLHKSADNDEKTRTGPSPEAIQAAAAEAERINSSCTGWQGAESPQESLINNDEGPALAMSESLKENCPIDLQ